MDPPLNFNLLMDLLGFDAEDHDFDLDLVPHAAIDDDVYIDMEELFADAVVDDDLDLEAFLDSVIDSDTTTIPGAVNAEKLMADFTPEKGYELGDCSICLETLHEELNSYSYLQCKDSLFFGLNSYSSIFISDKPYSILLPSGLSGSISISAALCGSGEDNCIWKGSSSGVYVKTGYNLGCNPVDFPCSGSISGN